MACFQWVPCLVERKLSLAVCVQIRVIILCMLVLQFMDSIHIINHSLQLSVEFHQNIKQPALKRLKVWIKVMKECHRVKTLLGRNKIKQYLGHLCLSQPFYICERRHQMSNFLSSSHVTEMKGDPQTTSTSTKQSLGSLRVLFLMKVIHFG